jgi:hypothetical protein
MGWGGGGGNDAPFSASFLYLIQTLHRPRRPKAMHIIAGRAKPFSFRKPSGRA